MSTRAIAPVVGTSHMSVARDLSEPPVTPVTPDPAVDHETGEILDEPAPAPVVPKIVDALRP